MKYSGEVFDELIQECTTAPIGSDNEVKMREEIKDLRDCLNGSKKFGEVVDLFIKDKESTSVEIRAMLAEIVMTGIHIGSMYQRAIEADEKRQRVEGKMAELKGLIEKEKKEEKKEEEEDVA